MFFLGWDGTSKSWDKALADVGLCGDTLDELCLASGYFSRLPELPYLKILEIRSVNHDVTLPKYPYLESLILKKRAISNGRWVMTYREYVDAWSPVKSAASSTSW